MGKYTNTTACGQRIIQILSGSTEVLKNSQKSVKKGPSGSITPRQRVLQKSDYSGSAKRSFIGGWAPPEINNQWWLISATYRC